MALNVIERLSLIAERLKDIADKIEGGGGGSLEPRVAALETTTQLLDSQKANDDIIALPFAGSGVAGNYYIYNKELWLCVTNTSTPPSQGSSAWNHKNVGEELTRARGDIVALNENILTKEYNIANYKSSVIENANGKICKSGNVVSISAQASFGSLSADTTLFSLPSELKPRNNVYILAYTSSGSLYRFYLDTGCVIHSYGANNAGNYVAFSISYVV